MLLPEHPKRGIKLHYKFTHSLKAAFSTTSSEHGMFNLAKGECCILGSCVWEPVLGLR